MPIGSDTGRISSLRFPSSNPDAHAAPALRYSGSSSTSRSLETPPTSPVSALPVHIVAAPVAGVATMDALVDRMNRFAFDDPFSVSSLSHHERSVKRTKSYTTAPQQPGPSRIPRPKKKPRSTPPHVLTSTSQSPSSVPEEVRQPSRIIIPSISDIVRAHAPATPLQADGPDPERHSEDLMSRSSIDTIADEVQRTLRQPLPNAMAASLTTLTPNNPLSTPTHIYSNSAPNTSSRNHQSYGLAPGPLSQSESITTYLRSTRLTTLVKIPRPFNTPLQVSLSDLGDPNGRPVLVFLGLGSVRYLMGLYDEMAEILGLRLITLDRWGLGRTSVESPNYRGIKEWAHVVAQVLDQLGIEQCSVVAHSAGAPYALSFASLQPERIKGDVCLLAPWVGGSENGGYKWLKYVPNGLLKTAQAAEWRLQAWMLGKPPIMHYAGIGYDRQTSGSFATSVNGKHIEFAGTGSLKSSQQSDTTDNHSVRSSEYDDLADFEGRFGVCYSDGNSPLSRCPSDSGAPLQKRRPSRSIFKNLLLRNSPIADHANLSPLASNSPGSSKTPRLKNLRSIGSLRRSSKSTESRSARGRASTTVMPALPPVGLGLSKFDWTQSDVSISWERTQDDIGPYAHIPPKRSISLTSGSHLTDTQKLIQDRIHCVSPHSGSLPVDSLSYGTVEYQAALANALIAASHAESPNGVHSDLMQILNHEGRSWGFSYGSYPHKLRVWYGDKDERIAEAAVRWMEKSMPPQRCEVNVIRGADHALMYRSGLIVEILEIVRSFWS